MTFERIGANELMHRNRHVISGRTLELGVGENIYAPDDATIITLDIDPTYGPMVVGDAHHLPFRDDAFTTVVASQVFEHLHTPTVAMDEVTRVLRPGGRTLLAVPFLYFLHQQPHDYYRYTEFGLRALCADRLRIDSLIGYGNRLSVAADVLFTRTETSSYPRRVLRKLRKAVAPPDPTRHHPRIGALLVRFHRDDFPSGYVLVATKAADPATD